MLEDKTNAFQLYLKKPTATIAPLTILSIPYVFGPSLMQEYKAKVIVQTESGMSFTFPLRGQAEGPIRDCKPSICSSQFVDNHLFGRA
jgi:hypothetical protein